MFEIKCLKCGKTTELNISRGNITFDDNHGGNMNSIVIDTEDYGDSLNIECRNCDNNLREHYN